MNIALGISATAAAMGYLVYSSKSQSIVSLKGKTVLITGAGSGVGRLTALQFAKEGCSNLVLWDLNAMGMKETQELILKVAPGVRICTAVVDVSSTKAVYEAAKNANAWASPSYVSVLINNAGIVSGKPLLETEDSKISKTFQVNVLAHFWTTKAFLPKMISEKFGHVVTVASIAGLTAAPKMVDYAASKHGAVGFASGLRKELKQMKCNVTTSLICPAHIKTNLFKGFEQPFVGSLSPDYVAQQILHAVKYRKEVLVMPKLADPRLMQALMPSWMVDSIGSALGLDSSMNNIDLTQANKSMSMIKSKL